MPLSITTGACTMGTTMTGETTPIDTATATRTTAAPPMNAVRPPASPLPELRMVELGPEQAATLQRFFEANPAYFLAVFGEPAGPDAARDEIRDLPPAGWSFTQRWLLGYAAADGELAAVADVVSDLLVPGVWHIGLFIVATPRHGSGDAGVLYRGLESWAATHGARWLRLGVVQGNARAERFWEAQGFVETRTRGRVEMGKRTNTLRVMVKPLPGGTLEAYLALVPRDRPEVSAPG
jgi:GNAT superfamily N-acetyltransferase